MQASVLSGKERADGARHRLHGQERDQLFVRPVLQAVAQNVAVLHAKEPVCRLSRAESVHILRQLLRHARRSFPGMNDAEPEIFVILQNHGKPAVPCPADFPDRIDDSENVGKLKSQLSGVRNNLIVAYGDDNVFATQILNSLAKETERYPITLVAAPDWTKFEKLLVDNLLQMNAIYIDDGFVDYNSDTAKYFDLMPGVNAATIRPALVAQGGLLKKGLASTGR